MPKKSNKQKHVSNVSKASKAKGTGESIETSEASETSNPPKPPTAAEVKKAEMEKIVQVLDGLNLELFHAPDGTAYVTYSSSENHDKNFRTSTVTSPQFKKFLQRQTFKKLGKPLKKSVLNDQIDLYSSIAEGEDSPERRVFLRVGEHGEDIYIDLCNDAGQAVKVTADDWTVVDDPDCRFRRAPGMRPLPVPVKGGSITELGERFLNLNPNDRILFLGALLGAFRFGWPTPLVFITGEHGSGKSSLSRVFRALIDPSEVMTQKASKDHDLHITCHNSWIVNFDNVSKLPTDMSDDLCQLATEGGFRTRQLRTDKNEALFSEKRMVLLNSIEELATRPDFLDRTIHLHTKNLKGQRRTENSLKILFQERSPRILGALLDAVVCALKNYPTTQVNLPDMVDSRMADFTKWVCAGAPKLGFTQEEFLKAYAENRTAGSHEALDASTIYLPLMTQLETPAVVGYKQAVIKKGLFRGTTQELLQVLSTPTAAWERPHDFPKTPKMLASMLARIIPNLRAEGVEVKDMGRDTVRRVRILEITKTASNVSNVSKPVTAATEVAVGVSQ